MNWQALKPTQVAGTIFNDLDDESVLAQVDMGHFEELFKTRWGTQGKTFFVIYFFKLERLKANLKKNQILNQKFSTF